MWRRHDLPWHPVGSCRAERHSAPGRATAVLVVCCQRGLGGPTGLQARGAAAATAASASACPRAAGREGDAAHPAVQRDPGLTAPGWGGEAPLWFYIPKEAELPPYSGERLGPVRGRIMARVPVGLLQRDPNSYLYLDPAWVGGRGSVVAGGLESDLSEAPAVGFEPAAQDS
jgi:hypothetical protein